MDQLPRRAIETLILVLVFFVVLFIGSLGRVSLFLVAIVSVPLLCLVTLLAHRTTRVLYTTGIAGLIAAIILCFIWPAYGIGVLIALGIAMAYAGASYLQLNDTQTPPQADVTDSETNADVEASSADSQEDTSADINDAVTQDAQTNVLQRALATVKTVLVRITTSLHALTKDATQHRAFVTALLWGVFICPATIFVLSAINTNGVSSLDGRVGIFAVCAVITALIGSILGLRLTPFSLDSFGNVTSTPEPTTPPAEVEDNDAQQQTT